MADRDRQDRHSCREILSDPKAISGCRRNTGGSSVHVTFLPDIGLSVQQAAMSVTMNVRNRRHALGGSRTAISTWDAHSTPLRAGSALPLRASSLVFICSMGQRKM